MLTKAMGKKIKTNTLKKDNPLLTWHWGLKIGAPGVIFVITIDNFVYEPPDLVPKVLYILTHLTITNVWGGYCFFLILQKGNGNPKRLINLPKVTVLISDRARIQTQALWFKFWVWFWRKSRIIRRSRGSANEGTRVVFKDKFGKKQIMMWGQGVPGH